MIDGILLSFQLFSRIAFKRQVEFSEKNIKKALYFLPLVGLVIGASTGFVVNFLSDKFQILAGVFGLVFYFYISGSFHLDGLSDLADGLGAHADKERTLAIMKDSNVGTFGVLALICYSFLKAALYSSFKVGIIQKIALSSILARAITLPLIQLGEMVRPGGFGDRIKNSLGNKKFPKIFYFLILIAATIIFKNLKILLLAAVNILTTYHLYNICEKRIGGLTGDIYGASIEINEIATLLAFWGLEWI